MQISRTSERRMTSDHLRQLATAIREAASTQDAAKTVKCAHVLKAAHALNLLRKKVASNV